MAFELKVVSFCEVVAQLRSMKPGENRDFQIDKDFAPIRVHCLDGSYVPQNVMFYIVGVNLGGNYDLWRSLEATACGIFYLQCKG